MKKEDEIRFFEYLMTAKPSFGSLIHPKREMVESYDMPNNRKTYLLKKWTDNGIWEYGVSLWSGWFEADAKEHFYRNLNPIKFRPHRGTLKEALNDEITVYSFDELFKYLINVFCPYLDFNEKDITIEKYGDGIDERCGYNTHIVMVNRLPIGFTNKNVKIHI